MSNFFSKFVGSIPVVGGALNDIGKVLPSAGHMIGDAMLPGVGGFIGGKLDPNTTPLQNGIGDAVAGTAATLGTAGLAGGALGGAGGAAGGAAGAGGGAAGAAGGASGILGSGISIPQLLGFAGNTASGIANYASQEAQRKQQAQEFAQQLGLLQGNQAMTAQSLLNRAPLADKGQYLALNMAAPQAFHPRDYTQGLNQLQGQPQGGAQAQLAANQAASANYKTGAGGVNTDTLKMILSKLGYAGPAGQPASPTG